MKNENTATDTAKEQRITNALDSVVQLFESGKAPAQIAVALFASADKPCSKWSFLNQLIVGAQNTTDARTFKQWQAADRSVKKGSHAFYIFSPIIKSEKEKNDSGEEIENKKLRGYKLLPVFAVQDTDGEPLAGPEFDEKKLPFYERAAEWNIEVRAEGFTDLTRLLKGTQALGVFRHYTNIDEDQSPKPNEIILATPEISVFFHELAHAAQKRLANRRIEREQHELYEVVAEFSAAVICEMAGISSRTLGNSYHYIKHHAEQAKLDIHKTLNLVLSDVKNVLGLILHEDDTQNEEELAIAA